VACCWDDAWRPAWRVALVPSYKAHRVAYGDVEEVPHELNRAGALDPRQVLDALGPPVVGAPDYEADDVIATLAAAPTGPVEVVTGDRDLFQLVEPTPHPRALRGRGVAKHERVDDAWLRAKYGITGAATSTSPCCAATPPTGCPA
jgi:5'-3' exonuclease